MKLIVALGNPGEKYHFTRHNFGFLVLDFYAKIHHLTWELRQKHACIYLKTSDFIIIKPQTFYNACGPAVQAFIHYYKIPLDKILVVCDDFDLNFGTLRLRTHGSAGGNNGLKSIIESLNSQDFHRLRLGTNNPDLRTTLGDANFVLSRFTNAEKSALAPILATAATKISDFLA